MVIGEFAQQMGQYHHHHEVGRIAVQAAHHAGMVPVIVAEIFDGLEGALDAGIEEDEQIDAADRDDPEEEEAKRAKLLEWIERGPEQPVERLLDQLETSPQNCPRAVHA